MRFEREKLIRFHHCDPAGIVFYPQYLVLCSELVEDWFAEGLGTDFHRLHHELGLGIPMRHLEADFLAPSRHGDVLTYSLSVSRIGNRSMTLVIEARDRERVRFAARQTVVWASLEGTRPLTIDEALRRRIQAFVEVDAPTGADAGVPPG